MLRKMSILKYGKYIHMVATFFTIFKMIGAARLGAMLRKMSTSKRRKYVSLPKDENTFTGNILSIKLIKIYCIRKYTCSKKWYDMTT